MTTWQAMNALEGLGYRFAPVAEGVRATLQGVPPPGAADLLSIVKRDKAAARAYVLERAGGAVVAEDGCTYSLLEALAIGQAVRSGDARLLGKVVYHKQPMTVTVYWEPLTTESPRAMLGRHKTRLIAAMRGSMHTMELCEWDSLTQAQQAKYRRYYRLLEGSEHEQQAKGQCRGT